MNQQHDLPLLGGIASAIRWCEELISLLSGPLLAIGLAIALIDLLTGGGLLRAVPKLLFAWGICQAVGIDAQLIATWDRCRTALRSGAWLHVVALAILGVALGYVGFLSAEAFGFQQAFGLSEAEALQRLGIDAASWQLQRAILAVFLVALSGFTRYHPQKASIADERAVLERELELEPLRQRTRAMKATGMATLARTTLASFTGDRPPTGPGTPVQAAAPSRDTSEVTEPARLHAVTNARSNGRKRRRVRTRNGRTDSVEARVREVYQPGMSVRELATLANVSASAASKYRKLLASEASQSRLAQ
jgi:hypothetical protein